MILKKEIFIEEDIWYLVKYDNSVFKVNTYEEFLNVFYEGNYKDSIEKKENFLIGLIKMVSVINNFKILIYNDNYKKINKKTEVDKKKFILYKKNINSIVNILNKLNIARVFKVIG